MATDLDALWKTWDAGGRTARDLDLLVRAAQPFVRAVVKAVPGSPEDAPEDLLSEAQIGLLSAINRFDPAHGVQFRSFAQHRIRGKAREAMRSTDSLPRSARRRATALLEAEQRATQRLSRVPTDVELAGELDWTTKAVAEARRDVMASYAAGALPEDGDYGATDDGFGYELIVQRLAAALSQLEGPERTIMVLYYVEELKMSDIAALLGISASMVSKVRDRAAVQVMDLLRRA